MACKDCERRRAQMKEWLVKKAEQAAKWAGVRNAKPAADTQPKAASAAKRGKAGRKAVRPSVDAPVPHGQQGVAGDTEGAAGQGAAMSDVPGSEPSHRGQ